MNRVHRVVWSESRQAFIVTNENARAKGKPSSTRKAVASAVLMALAAMTAPSAMAADVCGPGPTTINTAQTSGDNCILGIGDSLTVDAPGSITGAAQAVTSVSGGAAASIINNTGGTISGTQNGIRVANSSAVTLIDNAGGTISGPTAILIDSTSTVIAIRSTGTIDSGIGGTAIDMQGLVTAGVLLGPGGTVTGSIVNSGILNSGTSDAIRLNNSTLTGSITNSGSIAGSNNGIYLSSGSSVTGAITNNAASSITGSTGGSGAGIWLSSGSTVGSIVNDGTISGGRTGIRLSANSGGSPTGSLGPSSVTVDITNTGNISGGSAGISLNSGSSLGGSITNSGTIAGNNVAIDIRNGSFITGNITNDVGGTIIGRTAANTGTGTGSAIYVASASIGGSITNSGTITGGIMIANGSTVTGSITNNAGRTISRNSGGSSGAIAITNSSTVGSISNHGILSGGAYGILLAGATTPSLGVVPSSVTGSISNSGSISGSSNGIYLSRSDAGSIVNSGNISGWNGAVLLSNSTAGSITNDVGGTISSSGQTGLRITNSSTITGNIANNGTISGVNTALYISNGSSVGGNVANSGMISAHWAGLSVTNSSITGSITNSAGGTIRGIATNTGSSGHGIYLGQATVGSISNSGTIQGAAGSAALPGVGIRLANTSTVTGAIANNAGGTISGDRTGILIEAGSAVASISNAGTISGGTNAIAVNGSAAGGINIAGANTAGFVGAVVAATTPMTILAGATYTLKTADAFTVASFTNNGTAQFAAGASSFNLANVTGNTFANNGTLAVAATGTGTITGNYTQAAAGTFRTAVTNDTTYGKLVVTGTATLPANAKIDVNVANPNFAFTATGMAGIITAGTLTWDGTSVVTDNSVLFNFTASKNGNAVDLALAAVAPTGTGTGTTGGGGGGGTVVGSVTNTGNISAMGAAAVLDTLVTAFAGGGTGNADMDAVIGALGALTTQQQVADAVGQMLPLMTGGMGQAVAANLHGVNQAVQSYLESTGSGLSSGDDFVLNGKGWVKPLGSWADQKDSNGAFGYGAQTYGISLGADGELSPRTRAGAAFAYSHTNVNSNSGVQSAGVDSYQFVLYGTSSLNSGTAFNWQADYGYNQNKGSRYIAFVNRIAQASYNSDSIHLGAGVGHTMALNDTTSFTPSFRADYTSISDKGYTETGAGALNLVVNGKTTDEFILAADGKFVHSLNDNARFTANLGLGYDVNAKQNSITASFAGGGAAFTTNGINPSSTLVRGGLGYVANTAGGVEITARYDIEARTGYTGQTASVKARMPF